MENYSVSKISPGNCLRMKHQTLERTENHRSQELLMEGSQRRVLPLKVRSLTLLRSRSDKFTSVISQIPSFIFHVFFYSSCISCPFDGHGGAVTSPPQGSGPWWCLLQPCGFATKIQLTETQLCADICTRRTLGDVSSQSSTKTAAPRGPAASNFPKTPAFNSSPQFHRRQAAACCSVISSQLYWYTNIYLPESYDGSIWPWRWLGRSPASPENAVFQHCGQSASTGMRWSWALSQYSTQTLCRHKSKSEAEAQLQTLPDRHSYPVGRCRHIPVRCSAALAVG